MHLAILTPPRSHVHAVLNPSKLREDTFGLTLQHEIQRCRLQDLVILKEPQQALITINLPCPSDDRGDLRPRSFERPELLDLLLKTGDRPGQWRGRCSRRCRA